MKVFTYFLNHFVGKEEAFSIGKHITNFEKILHDMNVNIYDDKDPTRVWDVNTPSLTEYIIIHSLNTLLKLSNNNI